MSHTVGYTNSAKYKCLENLQKDAVDLCLIYCGLEHCSPSHRFGPNQRESHVLHIVRSGKGVLEINKKKYPLSAGDAFYIPPGTAAWYEADRSDPWAYAWIGFVGLKADEYISGAGFSLRNPVRKIDCTEHVVCYIEQIIEAYQLSFANELKRNGLLMLLFSELIDEHHQKNTLEGIVMGHPYPGAVYVKHAMDYMLEHYSERLKISELADYIGVNRSYLTISFKNTIGCSAQEYLINLRMEKAKSLLKKTNMPINAIASAVGYSDQLAFSKVFKQYCGRSPRMYKEEKSELIFSEKKAEPTLNDE